MTLERDKRVVALREEGRTHKEIAAAMGLGLERVVVICRSHAAAASCFLPDGVSLNTARDVERTIGLWPSMETAPEIAKRMMEVLNGTKRRKTLRELGAWLETLKLFP
jgi:hypothetical protein